ncbi:hypothetical protein [Lichenifustis flavocetrariae]|uniref:Uncharacterized protein n=1 Tax=Lichenifustis flavocetrariae TaxID=2949735 RepID=A0AA41Z1P0_9HYPH|nr:hypothetical protein [Lichenifustis flavocetrariae]MCW6511218.1 hypothetical protein [Lichenifustis flavocetrariae]
MTGGNFSARAVARLAVERPRIPPAEPITAAEWAASPDLDDRIHAYIVAVRGGFERLEDAVRQLAAVLILAAAGARRSDDHPVRVKAAQDLSEACDRLRTLSPPARAGHHHHHLLQAAAKTRAAMGQPWNETQRALHLLGEASDHLRWATGLLPGFEVVALGQGCGCCSPKPRM